MILVILAIITDDKNKKICGKLKDRGIECMFLGYSDNHAADVYDFFNWKTKALLQSRNVIWLNKNYAEYFNLKEVHVTKLDHLNEEEGDIISTDEMDDTHPDEDPYDQDGNDTNTNPEVSDEDDDE